MAHKVKCISYLIQAFSPLQPVWLWSHSFSLQPNFAFLTTNMFPLNSDWIAPDRCVRWQERRATYCYVRYYPGQGKLEGEGLRVGSEHIWWWPYSTPPSRAEAVWCTNWGLLIHRLSSVSWTDAPHLFFRASNNTFAWYLVNHDELHLANLFSRLSYRNPLHYDGVWAFNQFHILSLSMFLFIFSAHKVRQSKLVFSTLACYQCG